MPSADIEGSSRPLVTLDAIRAEHGRMLETDSGGTVQGADYVREVRSFVDRLVASSVYFDEMSERRTIQGYLDHWIGELSTRAKPEERSALTQLELHAFSIDALRTLQDTVVNPFATVAADLGAATEESRRSATAILKWIEERAKAGGVRCQEGLFKEIASQVAADPEGPTLLAFCLWHLFEDPATRVGNKIRRREGEVAFSCSAYLVEKTAWLYERQGESEQGAMIKALLAFSPDGSPGSRERAIPRRHFATAVGAYQFVLYGQRSADLEQFLLDARIVFPAPGDRLVPVHRTLLTHWPQLAAAKGQQAERKRWLRGAVFAAAVVAVTSLAWKVYADRQVALALQHANEATTRGGMATSYVKTWKPLYESSARAREEGYKASVGGAIWAALNEHKAQLQSALGALQAQAGTYEKTVGNDAVAATIGFLAQAGSLGQLEPRPAVTTCGPAQPGICLRVGRELVVIPSIPEAAGLGPSAISHDGRTLVQVWRVGVRPTLGVYRIGQRTEGDAATQTPPSSTPTVELLRTVALDVTCEAKDEGTDAVVRLSGDGRMLTFACMERTDEWSLVDLAAADGTPPVWHSPGLPSDVGKAWAKLNRKEPLAESETKLLTAMLASPQYCDNILTLRSKADAIYPASPGEGKSPKSYVTTNTDGYVRVWDVGAGANQDAQCPRAQFSSDFVRMDTVGAPDALAFQENEVKRYAIYRSSGLPPLIRIYTQARVNGAELITEHYPAYGLGTPISMRFSPNGKCLEVRTRLKKPLAAIEAEEYVSLRYYLSTEAPALTALTEALIQDLDAKSTTNVAQQATDWRNALPHYSAAVDAQCGLSHGS